MATEKSESRSLTPQQIILINPSFTLKDVQEWLGHSEIKMTANIYTHLDTARKTNMADSIAARFGAA